MALEDYIAVKPKFARYVPHTAGRYQKKRFRKAQCPIVERYKYPRFEAERLLLRLQQERTPAQQAMLTFADSRTAPS